MLAATVLPLTLFAAHEVVASSTTSPAPLVEREAITVAFGEATFEQYDVVHVSTPWAHRPMILVTPVGIGTAWFETSTAYSDTLLARLAYLGVDAWVVSPRHGTSATLPQGSCPGDPAAPDPAPVDCSAFGRWGLEDLVEDIAFVRDELLDSHRDPTIGGHFTGAMVAMAAVNAEPDAYAGLVLWEGTLYTEIESTLGKNAGVCDALSAVPEAYAADPTPATEALVTTLARTDPDGLSPFPQSALDPYFLVAGEATNLELLRALFVVDNFALLDRVSDGIVFAIGTVEDGFSLSDIGHVFRYVQSTPQATYVSLGLFADLACGLGGAPVHTSNLEAFEGDVLAIGSARGLDAELKDTLQAFSGARRRTGDFRGELGVHDLLFSDLRAQIDLEIAMFNLLAQLPI